MFQRLCSNQEKASYNRTHTYKDDVQLLLCKVLKELH